MCWKKKIQFVSTYLPFNKFNCFLKCEKLLLKPLFSLNVQSSLAKRSIKIIFFIENRPPIKSPFSCIINLLTKIKKKKDQNIWIRSKKHHLFNYKKLYYKNKIHHN